MKELENKAEYLPLSELVKLENNPRTIKKADFEKLKTSIKSNPDYFEARPIICSDRTGKNVILGGNQRYEAAKALGLVEVPVIVLHGLDEAREREIVIRDNVNNGDWDFDILANEWDESELEGFGISLPTAKTYEDGSLGRDFIQVPISVLDATKPSWVARKKVWKQLFSSEKGRGENLLGYSNTIGKSGGTSIFDPVLCELMYRWFGIPGGSILDPFCGGSVRGIVAGAMGYRYYGNDLRPEQVEENQRQLEFAQDYIEIKPPVWSVGDSADIAAIAKSYPEQKFDMIFSCPPYADLEVYSDDPRDISNMDYEEFLAVYRKIIAESVKMLKDNRFAVWVVGELRKKDGGFQHFVEDSIKAFEDAGMKYYNHAILVSGAGGAGLRVRRHMKNRKLVHAHQDVLVFSKGDVPSEELEGLDKEEMLEEFEADRQMLESHEEVLVFTNADSLKELQASFPEIGGKNA